MTWLLLILLHLFRPNVATPPVPHMCEELARASGETMTCTRVARWLDRAGHPDEAQRLLLEISNGF